MAVTKLFGDITIGGDHSDNPPNYSWTTFNNYPRLNLTKNYERVDVIAFHEGLQKDLQVTGLAEVVGGHAQTSPGDLCYLPCPEFCA